MQYINNEGLKLSSNELKVIKALHGTSRDNPKSVNQLQKDTNIKRGFLWWLLHTMSKYHLIERESRGHYFISETGFV